MQPKGHYKSCVVCKKDFYVFPCRSKIAKFCSKKCSDIQPRSSSTREKMSIAAKRRLTISENHPQFKTGLWTKENRKETRKILRRKSAVCRVCKKDFIRIKGESYGKLCQDCRFVKNKCLGCENIITIERNKWEQGRGKFCSLRCLRMNIKLVVPRGKKCHLYKDGRTKNRFEYNKNHRQNNSNLYVQYTINRTIKKKGNGGSHTLEEWENLKRKYDFMCLCCKQKEPFVKLTRDHIIPVSKNGSNDISNIQPLCGSCNTRKYVKIINYIQEYEAEL